MERIAGVDFQWGESLSPEQDPLRIGQNLSLAFEGRQLAAGYPGRSGQFPRILQNVIALIGPAGPMPLHFTELVRNREFIQGDPVLARFLDILLHRVFTLYYRAWALNRVEVSADRKPADDGILRALLSIVGLGEDALSGQGSIDPRSLAARAGHLSRPVRGRRILEHQLCSYFEVPVRVEEHVQCTTKLSDSGRFRLSRQKGRTNMYLGAGVPIGKTTMTLSDRFRVFIGPLNHDQYERFLPGEKSRERLEEWIRYYVGIGYDWDVHLLMDPHAARPFRLGKQGRLRRDAWAGRIRTGRPMAGYHRHFEAMKANT